jgi:hypothetical protein
MNAAFIADGWPDRRPQMFRHTWQQANARLEHGRMPRRAEYDDHALSDLCAAQDSLVTRAQLEELGVSVANAWRRTQSGGPWQRVLPGILAVHNGPLTTRQHLVATLLYAGSKSMVTGAAALPVHGFRRRLPVPPVHVLVPDERQRSSSGFVIVERTIRLPSPLYRDGLAVAPVARAVFDASRRLRKPDDVRAIVAEAVQRRLTTPAALRSELSDGQRRGSRLFRSALEEVDAGIASVAEGDARRLVRKHPNLAGMWWNPLVSDAQGRFLLSPDGWLDDIALAWQIDSLEFHLSPDDYAKTLHSHTSATTSGIVVVHHLPSDLRRRPAQVIEDLEAGIATASGRPRPDVHAVPRFSSAA